MPKITHTETTPNANALMYVADAALVKEGALSFDSPDAAASLPLAKAVFALGDINSVFIQGDRISVNAAPGADWTQIRATLEEGLKSFTPVESAPAADKTPSAASGDLLDRINAAIDKFVRPVLAGDGGGLEVVALEGNTVQIQYQGACGGCPNAVTGTLMAIETLLRDKVDPNLTVEACN